MADHFEDWLAGHQVEPLAPGPDAYQRVARSARRRRAGRAAATAAVVSVVLAATAGTAFRFAHPPGPVDPPATTPTVATPSPTPAGAAPPSPPGSSPPASSPGTDSTRPVTGRCRTGELRITTAPSPGGASAGSVWEWLIFTNTSDRTCTLYGFPGVSYLSGASGTQINDPAARDGGTPVRVTLAPGQGAHAVLRTGHYAAYLDTCNPVPAAGYRVYVPDETASVFVPRPWTVCSTNGVNGLTVSAIYPGTTE
ncbi:DUF4232 domain-containing protein [Dactylosporangium sp. NPDC049525]|uniref:DUF4232 domain-containing protein n=1 Tax=Dactylosporangium sp. NPDC049525 TaxID=3154730 RepID=UPI0034141651